MSQMVFNLKNLKRHFLDASAPTFIPSPVDIACQFKDCVTHSLKQLHAYTKYVRAEQEAFQQRLNAVGIERLSRLTTREVIEMYGCP